MSNETRKNSQDSARRSRHEHGVSRGDNSSNQFFLEPDSSDRVRAAFRRSLSEFESAYSIEQWRVAYAKTIVPISATLAGATIALAWFIALLQSMVVVK